MRGLCRGYIWMILRFAWPSLTWNTCWVPCLLGVSTVGQNGKNAFKGSYGLKFWGASESDVGHVGCLMEIPTEHQVANPKPYNLDPKP